MNQLCFKYCSFRPRQNDLVILFSQASQRLHFYLLYTHNSYVLYKKSLDSDTGKHRILLTRQRFLATPYRARICKRLRNPRINSKESIPPAYVARARICRSFKKTRYRFSAWRAGTKPYLSYWPARLHRLAKSIPQNRFLGSINNYKYGLWRAGITRVLSYWLARLYIGWQNRVLRIDSWAP